LDFSTHANALNHIIEELHQEYSEFQSREKIFNINIVLYVFDLLTKVPTKRWIHNNSTHTTKNNSTYSSSSSLSSSSTKIKQQNQKQKYINKNPILKIIHKYLTDFDIENEEEWKIEKENLKAKSSELHISNHSFDPTLSNEQKAYYHYLRGYLYNILDHYHYLAEKNLSMAVKLDPNLSEAWSELAECYLKKYLLKKQGGIYSNANDTPPPPKSRNNSNHINNNHETLNKSNPSSSKNSYLYSYHLELTLAKHCLERAITLKPTVKIFNNMALTLRKIETDFSGYKANLEKSISLSKKAISNDINDSTSWASLGISYLEKFFNISRDTNDLQSSLKAYTIAFSHCKKEKSLDMLLNRYMINSYLENYKEAMDDLKLMNKYIKEKVFSSEFYSSFSLEEIYRENTNQLSKLEQYVEKVSSLIQNKCNIKDKYFLRIEWGKQNPILDIIGNSNEVGENKNFIENKDNRSKSKVIPKNIEQIMVSSLKFGLNKMKYLRLRVISEVTTPFGFNRSLIAVDETNQYVSLSIYNLRNDISLIGKEILVYEPIFNKIKIKYDKNTIEYNTIRIDLYSQRSIQRNIGKECPDTMNNNENENENEKQATLKQYTLNDLKKLNLIVNNEFLDDLNDVEYSKIQFDYS